MTSEPPKKDTLKQHTYQNVGSAGRDVHMTGGDNIKSQKISFNLWISIILVVTLGALTYLGIRLSQTGVNLQIRNGQQSSPEAQETITP